MGSPRPTLRTRLQYVARHLWWCWRRHAQRVDHDAEFSYVVIVTFGRSGSTVLQHALNRCQGAVIRGENAGALRHLQQAYAGLVRARDDFGGRSATDPSSPWYGIDLFDDVAMVAKFRSLVLEELIRPPVGTSVCGFKEVRFTSEHFATFADLVDHLVFLDAVLPGVRFVINTRDPLTACQSGWWRDRPGAQAVLEETVRWFETLPGALTERLGPDRCHLMAYEQWSSDPHALVDMARFCDLALSAENATAVLGQELDHMRTDGSAR